MKFLINYLIIFTCFGIVFGYAQESQNNILKNFESGNYTVYKLNDKEKFEKVKKTWPVNIAKTGDNVSQVLVKRSGILDEPFTPDVPGYPAYFAYKTFRLSFLKDYAVYYEWNGKQQATTKYILVKPSGSFGSNWETTNKNVAAYATATFKNQTGARANVKEAKAEIAEVERKVNSLEGKAVAKIEIQLVSKPAKVAHFSEAINYGVVASLKDGSQLKTSNLGGKIPWEDFKLNNEGCSNTRETVRVDEDASKFPNDEIVLRLSSVYHPSLKAEKKIVTTNDVSIRVNRNGFWGHDRRKHMAITQGLDGQHAGRGDNLTVKVKTVKHKQTEGSINKIEIYNETKGKTVARYKLSLDTELTINAVGGQGMNAFDGSSGRPDGGHGGNGGAGGNVTFVKDPSAVKHNIKINTDGGKGGKGGAPKYSSASHGRTGSSGDNGTLKTETKNVTLNF